MSQVVIVGGGITGLAAAFRLSQIAPDANVTLLERCDRPGGNIWTERLDGFQIETGPNGFLDAKPHTIDLCRDLGLGEKLIPASEAARKNRYVFWHGRLQALPGSIWSFITSPLLSWRGKLNLILESFRRRPPGLKADESVAAFVSRRAGKEAAALFADALVTGIHAGDANQLSMQAAFPRVARMEREHRSVFRGMSAASKQRRREAEGRGEKYEPGRMWSFRDGLRLLIEALREQLGRELVSAVRVKRIQRDPVSARWQVEAEGRDRWQADAVVLACPAHEQAPMLADVDAELADDIAGICYNRIAVVALGFRAADVAATPAGFGYIAPSAARRDLLGVQWCSSIFPGRAPSGMVLWRALCGGVFRRDMIDWDDVRLVSAVRAELGRALHVRAEPVLHHIVRWPRAIPQYELGHLERVERIERKVGGYPGLFLTGNAYHGVAMNDCVEQAQIIAHRVAKFLTS